VKNKKHKFYINLIKPIFDFVISLLAFIVLLPLFLLISALLIIANKGTPFFFQSRPGKNEKLFRIIKFKTMNDKKDKDGNLLNDHERITPIGKIIRKLSLDEIPQLINIIKCDMSFIGPRPLLIEYLPLYNEDQKKRHNVKPGLSGWAQVNGRNLISWEDKFKFDVWYVENCSLTVDIKIIILTIIKVIKRDGINMSKEITMDRFNGNDII
jgi:lipopolysaccharide/colanic/teichoic acid biosynthesis glycosyltransferase